MRRERFRVLASRRFPFPVLVVALGLGVLALAPVALGESGPWGAIAPAANPTVDYVNITATAGLQFQPSTFTVYPGALVHLVVTQAASFDHTFNLSADPNTTFSSVAAFESHPQLVRLDLGSVAGKKSYANFTAPAIGTYEYLCEIHFPGMIGTMTSTTGPGGGSGGSGTVNIPPGDWVLIGVGVVVVLAAVGGTLLLLRRRNREERLYGSERKPRAKG